MKYSVSYFSSVPALSNRIITAFAPPFPHISKPHHNTRLPSLRATLMPEDDEDFKSEALSNGDSQMMELGVIQDPTIVVRSNVVIPAKETEELLLGMPVQSFVLLNLVAIVWGTQHSVIKMVVGSGDTATGGTNLAAVFTLARFLIGTILASPFTPSILPVFDWIMMTSTNSINATTSAPTSIIRKRNDENDELMTWRWGAELGIWMFLGYALQAIGLEYTTASKSGFLLYLNVKFVPFFARILFGRNISVPTWISAAAALLGTGLLVLDASGTNNGISPSSAVNVGDLWSIGAAMASAMFILRLESALSHVRNSSALSSASLWVVTLFSFVWTLWSSHMTQQASSFFTLLTSAGVSLVTVVKAHPVALVYLGGVTTALANYLQAIGQRGMTAERASILYAMDPVYGAVFAYLLLDEHFGAYACVGASIITIAAATNAYMDFGSNPKLE